MPIKPTTALPSSTVESVVIPPRDKPFYWHTDSGAVYKLTHAIVDGQVCMTVDVVRPAGRSAALRRTMHDAPPRRHPPHIAHDFSTQPLMMRADHSRRHSVRVALQQMDANTNRSTAPLIITTPFGRDLGDAHFTSMVLRNTRTVTTLRVDGGRLCTAIPKDARVGHTRREMPRSPSTVPDSVMPIAVTPVKSPGRR